ncbi:EAL domain-containing protein [Alteromonas ponticola]|uniref:EAL domain-containing protein n=1 Tax=Alteromonas ponticola TaxID=2720613 RepID=A0ABX1QWF4_9ALTE|nr:GGDEF domain-containing phosphodiesterase [Alteromonas ponticola]NMH58577.1 EAL domain-containing protein [Alteromonas ponticola]
MHLTIKTTLIGAIIAGVLLTGALCAIAVWIASYDLLDERSQRLRHLSEQQVYKTIQQSAETLHQQATELQQSAVFQTRLELADVEALNRIAEQFSSVRDAAFTVDRATLEKPLTYGLETINNQVYLKVSVAIAPRLTLTARETIKASLFSELVFDYDTDVLLLSPTDELLLSTTHLTTDALSSMVKVSPENLSATYYDTGEKVLSLNRLNSATFTHPGLSIFLLLDLSPQSNILQKLLYNLLWLVLLLTAIMLFAAHWLGSNISKSLVRLSALTESTGRHGAVKQSQFRSNFVELTQLHGALNSLQHTLVRDENYKTHQSHQDRIPGLFNRAYFDQEVTKSITQNVSLQLVFFKLLDFDAITKFHGADRAEFCLHVIAKRIRRWPGKAARTADGDIAFFPEHRLTDAQIETLYHIVEQPVEQDFFSISINIAVVIIDCPTPANDVADIDQKVSVAFAEAAARDQKLIHYNNALDLSVTRQFTLAKKLNEALLGLNEELTLVYQPVYNLLTNTIDTVEALLRWKNAELGNVEPEEFLQVASAAGMLTQVTDWVIRRALSDLARFRQQGCLFKVAINISAADIHQDSFVEKLVECVKRNGLKTADVEIEIKERDIASNGVVATQKLKVLHDQGFNIAIDDFGTGYLTLNHLKAFSHAKLKLDKFFAVDVESNQCAQRVMQGTLALARDVGCSATAKGVECNMTLALLKELGFTQAQGFHLSKPVSANELTDATKQEN